MRAYTRNGNDGSALELKCRSAILDGEMCVQNAAGMTDFGALRRSIKGALERLVLFAFDLLVLDGKDLRSAPLRDRRRRLQDFVGTEPSSRIHFSQEHAGGGPAFFRAADQHGLEGIVSKCADSPYVSGRAKSWLKVKSCTVGDYAVLGVERSRKGLPVALLASLEQSPSYVGDAVVTLKAKEREQFWRTFDQLGTPRSVTRRPTDREAMIILRSGGASSSPMHGTP